MPEPSTSLSLRGYRAVTRTYRGTRTALRRLNASRRQAPGFLILGAAKAGTTSLHHYLLDHPQVSGPTIKEIHYFDHAYHRGAGWYRAHFEPRRQPGEITGESTPYYLFHPLVPARVASDLPEAKLIALLRNPIDRAYSHHNHECVSSYESLPFDEAIEREEERLRGEEERLLGERRYCSFSHQHHSYLARGRYADQLERWFAQVGRERILVLGAEDLFEDPAGTVKAAQEFLGLEPHTPSDLAPRNVRSYSPISEELRERLKAMFEPHNQRLYSLVGRDFGWD
jgi:hypothetical protein